MLFAKQKINTLILKLRQVPKTYLFVGGVLLVMAVYIVTFRQQTLVYDYSGVACDKRLVLLPGIFNQAGSKEYKITTSGGFGVAGHKLMATSLCVSPVVAPAENTSETLAYAPWGGWVGRFTYRVQAEPYPKVSMDAFEKPVPVTRDLLLPLSKPDTTFSYKLAAAKGKADCAPLPDDTLKCNLPDLELEQGAEYDAALERYFKNQVVEKVANINLKTLSPLSITESSIASDAVVYDKPTSVVLKADKPVKQGELEAWRVDGEAPEKIDLKTDIDGSTIAAEFITDLPRQATIVIKSGTIEAVDGSTPLDEQLLMFKTSGGPRVTAINVGSSGVMPGSKIVVTFDQELSAEQDVSHLVATSGGVTLQARQGNQMVFSTEGAARCVEISIALKSEIESPYGISGQSAWQYNGRMSCYTVSTIGYSAQGRPIYAYHFGGSGPSVVYTGAIHGNEVSTKYLMDRWIAELDSNPGKIPGGKQVIVVPTINPDGFAASRRENARGIDLNRNFAVSDWKKDIEHTDGSAFPGGGGESPMSEPEVQAIAGFIARQRPELVVSYHSIGWLVISNQRGQANVRASQYAGLSGYRLSPGGGGEFNYQITGTADDYYGEQLGVPSILIELGSHSYHQFEKNRAAMWAMLN